MCYVIGDGYNRWWIYLVMGCTDNPEVTEKSFAEKLFNSKREIIFLAGTDFEVKVIQRLNRY